MHTPNHWRSRYDTKLYDIVWSYLGFSLPANPPPKFLNPKPGSPADGLKKDAMKSSSSNANLIVHRLKDHNPLPKACNVGVDMGVSQN